MCTNIFLFGKRILLDFDTGMIFLIVVANGYVLVTLIGA